MALINFRPTSFIKAFFLHAFVSAITAALAIEVRIQLENKSSNLFKYISNITPEDGINGLHKIIFTIITTFIIYIIINNLMYFLVGWGEDMIVSKKTKVMKYF